MDSYRTYWIDVTWFPLACAAVLLSAELAAQEAERQEIERVLAPVQAVGQQERERDFVVLPIPLSNPTVGTGLAGVGLWIYELDEESPPSRTAVGVAITDQDSWAIGGDQRTYLKQDKFRVNGTAADTTSTYDGHPSTPPFIAYRLIQRLVTSNPSNGYVYRVAKVFNRKAIIVRYGVFLSAGADEQERERAHEPMDFHILPPES